MKKHNPSAFIEDGSLEKRLLNEALHIQDWDRVQNLYARLKYLDIDLGSYSTELEAIILEMVEPLSSSLYRENYQGYITLSIIIPGNLDYAEKAQLYKERLISTSEAAIAKLRSKYDKVEATTWYHHPNQPNTGAYLYIGQNKDGRPWLRLRGQYTSKYGWLFIRQVTAWHDDIKSPLLKGPFERRNTSRIWEWQDVRPTDAQITIMRSLANSDDSLLRFEGDSGKGNRDHPLTRHDKQAILDVLAAFEAMEMLHDIGKTD